MERTNPDLTAALQRQASTSLGNRQSQDASIDYAAALGAAGFDERNRYQSTPSQADIELISVRIQTDTAI